MVDRTQEDINQDERIAAVEQKQRELQQKLQEMEQKLSFNRVQIDAVKRGLDLHVVIQERLNSLEQIVKGVVDFVEHIRQKIGA